MIFSVAAGLLLANAVYVHAKCAILPTKNGTVVIPASWTKVDDNSFYRCASLKTLVFESESKLKSIGKLAFAGATISTTIVFPKSLTSIGKEAFSYLGDLPSFGFEIDSQLETINDNAFTHCFKLKGTIVFPKSLKSIEPEVFRNSFLLEGIFFESGSQLETIGARAFFKCNALKSINIPKDARFLDGTSYDVFDSAGCDPSVYQPGNIVEDCVIVPQNPITKKPSLPPSNVPSLSPTTAYQRNQAKLNALELNYDITFNSITFSDSAGQFELALDYDIGANAKGLTVSLFETGCETTYSGPVVTIQNTTDVDEIININKKYFSVANTTLVTHDTAKGLSKGSLDFCIKAQTFMDHYSVAFHKQNLKLSFDLTTNNFSVLNNDITTNEVTTADLNITSVYKVEACQCGADNFTCLDHPYLAIGQNDLINICVFPALDNRSAVEVSNFYMEFKVGGFVKLSPASIGSEGPLPSSLSVIFKSDDVHKVTSRLVTSLFDGGNTQFNIEGNAYLRFKSARRLLDQSMQDTDAGVSYFSLDTKIQKKALPAGAGSQFESRPEFLVLSVVVGGGCLTLAIAFVILKKMKK